MTEPKAMKPFKDWFLSKDVPYRKQFAAAVGASYGYLRLVAYGFRQISVELAAKVERESSRRGERIQRGDVSPTCNRCPYYRGTSKKIRNLV